ncbi:MAG: helix-turn-helix domain-containing protein [Pseudomonadota bacterium]
MKAWTLSTDSYPEKDQRGVWLDAMQQLCLPVTDLRNDETAFHGRVSCLVSPLGMEFALLEGEAMTLSGSYTEQPEGIWLSVNVDGEARLLDDSQQCTVERGDIIYGPTGTAATLQFPGNFRQLFIKAPRLALNPRVMVPMSLSLGHLKGDGGIQHVFSGTLLSLVGVLTEVKSYQLRPIELSITEFLLTCLESEKTAFGLGGIDGIKAAHFHQICQQIETVLAEPNLSLKMVAEMSGVSPRYMQKLFAEAGKSVSSYIRTRRLERCRQDLASPLHAKLTISEICFRWGFNGTAHFSRSFRNEYGETPRDFRQSVDIDLLDS